MKIKLVRQHGLKAEGFFKEHGGKIFDVIRQRNGGYDVDLAPIGHPGKWGWMYNGEIEVVDDTSTLLERFADIQHAIWSHWMRYQFSVCINNPDGSCTIPANKVVRWKRQMETSYGLLTDEERESDREQAHKILGITRNG